VIVGILQARMGSTRLPGKVLMEILGRPLLQLQIERLKRSKLMDQLVVATTESPLDNAVENLCSLIEVPCFRGSENDVLDRYYQAARKYDADYIVRLTGDDPLSDPELVDRMINKMLIEGCDALSNSFQPTYPEGLDATILSFKALKKAWSEARLQSQREHVTPYIFAENSDFNVYHFRQKRDDSKLRWTVDYEEDFRLIEQIYNALYLKNPSFTTDDVYSLLDKDPLLKSLNSKFFRNAGLIESQKNDEEV
jgi:spore coat polysaccharide biosynthesis protein SpsF (cytidylyltransferase family)